MAQVVFKNVRKLYDNEVEAVKKANLEIGDKEFMVIVGPSGCGKTTMLRMIAGLEAITEGTIMIGERVVNDIPAKDRDIAMVFQNYALYPHMTVFENMAFGLKLRKYPKLEIISRVSEAASMLGIEQLLDRKPKALSGGQRQRVALGRAIVRNPAVFLFDEPLSNLDAKLRVTTRAELKTLHRKLKTTSIYVTHDQSEAMTLGDRVCVMCDGAIQQVAPPMEVYDMPVNRFVAGFLGTPPMNFFDGLLRQSDGQIVFMINNDATISLPLALKNITNNSGKRMTLGIRPEHLSIRPIAGQNNNEIRATAEVVEPLGDRKCVYFLSKSGLNFIVIADPHFSINTGDTITIYIDVNEMHIFEQGPVGRNIRTDLLDDFAKIA